MYKRQSNDSAVTFRIAPEKYPSGTLVDLNRADTTEPVSYTHLDVYKRQAYYIEYQGLLVFQILLVVQIQ